MPGPLPDPKALRRDRPSDKASWIDLPSTGRKGDAPPWPLTKATPPERKQWAKEWAKPQAAMWERDGQQDEVAIYVRTFLRSQDPAAATSLLAEVRQMRDGLGLSQEGLLRRRWKIDEPVQRAVRTDDPNRSSAKARFQVINGEAAG